MSTRTKKLDWTNCPTIQLTVSTVGALGKYLPAREAGVIVPTDEAYGLDSAVKINLSLGDAAPRKVLLYGYVDECNAKGDAHELRVQLDRRSWKRLFVNVCRTPWRRRSDFVSEDPRGRRPLKEEAFFYVPRTGRRFEANILEVSDTGAFIGLEGVIMTAGDEVRFRGRHDMSWHSAEVRWHGMKDDCPGVGVALDFKAPEDRSRWVTWLSFSEQRAA